MNLLALFKVYPSYNVCFLMYKPPRLVFDGFFIDVHANTMATCLATNSSIPQCFVKVAHFDSLHSSGLAPPTNHLHMVNATQPIKIVFYPKLTNKGTFY